MYCGDVCFWTPPGWEGLPWLAAGVSTRVGGVSEPPYASLNLGLHVGDNPEAVRENRRRAAEALGFPLGTLVCAEQVHGAAVAAATLRDAGRGAMLHADSLPGVDALITDTPGILLALFYADCLPVFFACPERRAVGIAHGGWRGLVGGVLENTVAAMAERFGVRLESLMAAIGPGIGPCCFEVGPEVGAQFPEEAVRTGGARPHVDLATAARLRLQAAGVQVDSIAVCGECTACHSERWFSHRRDNGKTGRMGGFIGLRPR